MNPAQPTRATVTSSISKKLRRRFDLGQSVAAPSLLTWFEVIGYTVLLESDIASLKYRIGRTSYSEVILGDRLYSALLLINPTLPDEAIAAAINQITTTDSNKKENNRRFHQFLVAQHLGLAEVVCINASRLLRDPQSKLKDAHPRLWLELHWMLTQEQEHLL